MYPNITLQIKNLKTKLVYYISEDNYKELTAESENLGELVINLAKKLNLTKKTDADINKQYLDLLELARESDETYILDYPEIDLTSGELELESAVSSFLGSISKEDPYKMDDLDEKIREELKRNVNSDIFASALDYLYVTMVAKALLAGSEMGIGNFRLDDDSKNARLQEKMAMELERMGVDFIVE